MILPLEQKSISESDQDQLADKYLLKLFVQSFHHSQGSYPLQHQLFIYIHSLHPSLKLSNSAKHELKAAATKTILHMFGENEANPPDHSVKTLIQRLFQRIFKKERSSFKKQSDSAPRFPHGSIDQQVTRKDFKSLWIKTQIEMNVRKLQRICNDSTLQVDWSAVLENLMEKDRYYVVAQSRPNRPEGYDAHRSFFCYYGLDEHTTGVPEFNQFYSDLIAQLMTSLKKDDVSKDFREKDLRILLSVLRTYYSNHPVSDRAKNLLELITELQLP